MTERNQFNDAQEKWLRDLETTDAKQGKSELYEDDRFCCLGRGAVVCGVSAEELCSISASTLRDDDALDRVRFALRLRDDCGSFMVNAAENITALTEMNDNGSSFKEIAAFIRANPWQVFTNFDKPGDAE